MKSIIYSILLFSLIIIFNKCNTSSSDDLKPAAGNSGDVEVSSDSLKYSIQDSIDLISKYGVLTYAIDRSCQRSPNPPKGGFDVFDWQIVHIEPVPYHCYCDGSFYIPFLMKGNGTKENPIEMTIANPWNISVKIESCNIEWNAKLNHYEVHIVLGECVPGDNCYKTKQKRKFKKDQELISIPCQFTPDMIKENMRINVKDIKPYNFFDQIECETRFGVTGQGKICKNGTTP